MATPAEEQEGACTDTCGVVLRIFMLILGALGIGYSIATVASCEFAIVTPPALNMTQIDNITVPDVTWSFGLFRYDPDGGGCRDFSAANITFATGFQAARWSGCLAASISFAALGLVCIEVVCCRFACSRCSEISLFFMAIIGQCMTFLVFTTDLCKSNFRNAPYPCSVGTGAGHSIVAVVCLLLTLFLTCGAPRPKPLCIRLRQDHAENDPCLCPWGKKPKEGEEDDHAVEEGKSSQPPAVVPPPVSNGPQYDDLSTYPYPSQIEYDPQEWPHGHDVPAPSGAMSVVSLPTYRDATVLDGELFVDADSE